MAVAPLIPSALLEIEQNEERAIFWYFYVFSNFQYPQIRSDEADLISHRAKD